MSKELARQLEEQQKQILNYERKLKDVVRAYKSLETEKKALEIALEAVSSEAPASTSSTNDNAEESSSSEATEESKVEALKQAISTLTVENKKKELAFQADRKVLLKKNEDLKTQLDKLKSVENAIGNQKKLKERLNQVEIEREKMLADHGAVLAEMQSRYAKERMHAEQMEKQISELYKKLQAAEENAKRTKLLEKEISDWKQKAEGTPSVRVIREELANAKKAHAQELYTLTERYCRSSTVQEDKDKRIVSLEKRVQELTEENVTAVQQKAELLAAVDNLEKKLNFLMSESESLMKAQRRLSMEVDENVSLEDKFIECYSEIRHLNPNFDVLECLNIVPSRLSITPEPTSLPADSQSDTDGPSAHCGACESAQKDLSYFKNLIGHLQSKLRTLESSHELAKKDHNEVTSSLRVRIADLETAQEKTYAQLTDETKRKVAELEEEMAKQRTRMMEIISEKDHEIELTKSSLAALYSQQYASDPVDPPQCKTPASRKSSNKLQRSSESLRSAVTYQSEEGEHEFSPPPPAFVKRSLSNHLNDSKNIFYEQELSRREQEITELRHIIRLSETKVREIEQASLTKDCQYLQIVETLKEEIRVLEGRLTLQKSEVNLEYLRNVFVQFLSSNNPTSRKHILKAISAVLKLTATEMRKVDSWNI